MKTYKVTWIDSESVDGWQQKEAFEMWTKEELPTCTSVGFLIEKENHVIIYGDINKHEVGRGIKIPRVNIISMNEQDLRL